MDKELLTKEDLLSKLCTYSESPDDDNIIFKEKIKNNLLKSPELLYALNNKELESELFNDDGTINYEGEWDRYFGVSSNIRPYLFIPQAQEKSMNFVCYQTAFDSSPRYNDLEKYAYVTFTIFTHQSESVDDLTGIPRHDLIASIIRERLNWSNIFGTQCKLTSSKEYVTDNYYTTRTLIFQSTNLNSAVRTSGTKTSIINNSIRR